MLSSELVTLNDKSECIWCTILGHSDNQDIKCYHLPMMTEAVVQKMEHKIVTLEEHLSGYAEQFPEIR